MASPEMQAPVLMGGISIRGDNEAESLSKPLLTLNSTSAAQDFVKFSLNDKRCGEIAPSPAGGVQVRPRPLLAPPTSRARTHQAYS